MPCFKYALPMIRSDWFKNAEGYFFFEVHFCICKKFISSFSWFKALGSGWHIKSIWGLDLRPGFKKGFSFTQNFACGRILLLSYLFPLFKFMPHRLLLEFPSGVANCRMLCRLEDQITQQSPKDIVQNFQSNLSGRPLSMGAGMSQTGKSEGNPLDVFIVNDMTVPTQQTLSENVSPSSNVANFRWEGNF